MGGCLLPISVHSGKHQICPTFCSLVGHYQEIEANFVFGTLKNTKKWNIRSVFIFNIFHSTTKLRTNSPINKLHHFTPICCQKVGSMNVGYVAPCELSSQGAQIEASLLGKKSLPCDIGFWNHIFTLKI